MILNKRRPDRLHPNANENIQREQPPAELIAEARRAVRKIIVYLAERAAVADHRQEHGGD